MYECALGRELWIAAVIDCRACQNDVQKKQLKSPRPLADFRGGSLVLLFL